MTITAGPNRERFLYLAIFAVGFCWTLYIGLASAGVPVHDELAHYFISRDAWQQPELLLSMWGRPVRNIVYWLPAIGGLKAARVFSVILTGLTIGIATEIGRLIGVQRLYLIPLFIWFQPWVSVFGSVNESSVEHLKLFFWPALIAALVQHAYMRKRVNNFWWAKGVAILVAPIVLLASFYFYLGIALPIYGRGFLWADIGTGALGVLTGNILSYRIMTAPPLGSARRNIGLAIIGVLGLHFATAAYLTPRFFLYENFFGYKYSGDFGILPDYSKYLIFRSPEEYEAIKAAESASASS